MYKLLVLFLTLFLSSNYLFADSNKLEQQLLAKSKITSKNFGRTYLNDIFFYGVGSKNEYNNYDGFGLRYNSDILYTKFEKHDDFSKTVLIYKIDVNKKLYKKFGFGYLEKKETVLGIDEYLKQATGGFSVGYGDSDTYNLEIGYINSDLFSALGAETNSDIYYIESAIKKDFSLGTFDSTLSYQYADAYCEDFENYTNTLGYYPHDDFKTTIKYTTIELENNEYVLKAGLNYKFDNLLNFSDGFLTSLLTATLNNSKNVQTSLKYNQNISNRSLKVKDKFKELISTSNIIAREVNNTEFDRRTLD